jgi:hypothetical protein
MTTVRRALAHRLKGKNLLIDGIFIAGTDGFYTRIHHVFEAAEEMRLPSPSLKAPTRFLEDGEERGLYRYLLTGSGWSGAPTARRVER